jgi:hypothetical protein
LPEDTVVSIYQGSKADCKSRNSRKTLYLFMVGDIVERIGGHGRSSAKEGPNQEMPVTADDDPKTRYASFELLVR